MKGVLRNFLFLFFLVLSVKAQATHIFGGDLYYTAINDSTYTITLVVYGDCSGAAFPSLPSSKPTLDIYKDSVFDTTVTMSFSGPTIGVEVTPICPKYADSTACHGGDIPGIKKFVFTVNVVIPAADTSSKWSFQFNGNLASTTAGRSSAITNLSSAGTMILVDSLNNTKGPNSSAQFTVIPTPFFCDNEPASYNPGAVAPSGTTISINLVPGISAVYAPGFSGSSPLAISDTLKIDQSIGQLSFTPDKLQKALLVEQVDEYKGGILVGTSMREMTVVVLNCTNPPAQGPILPISGRGDIKVSGQNSITVCKSAGKINIQVAPTAADSAQLTITSSGLPAGATFTIVGDSTISPVGSFNWDVTDVPPGSYTFYLSFAGNECPLESTSTQAYTVTVLPYPTISVKQLSLASCKSTGNFTIVSPHPWYAEITQGTTIIRQDTSLNSDTLVDSLNLGTYHVHLTNGGDCSVDTDFVMATFPPITVDNVVSTRTTCFGYHTGIIDLSSSGGHGTLTYTIDSLALQDTTLFQPMNRPSVTTGHFDSLGSGVYKIFIADINGCSIDTVVNVAQPDSLAIVTSVTPNKCIGVDSSGGASVAVVGGTRPYHYLWSAPGETDSFIANKPNGYYQVLVSDANNCVDSARMLIDYDDCCTPFVPSGFTPNGDGKNDVFRISFKGDIKLHEFAIYNRYGQQVFYTIYPHHGWDGTFGGVPQDVGTYFYLIKFDCGDRGDHPVTLTGDLTLIR